jgi:hypothetical protein
VQEFVLVSGVGVAAVVWRRTEGGWLIEDVVGPNTVLHLPSIGVELPLEAVDRGIPPIRPATNTTTRAS